MEQCADRPALRAWLFCLALFLVVTAHYQLKSLSRTLVLSFLGSANIPFVWMTTIIAMLALIPLGRWPMSRSSAFGAMNGTCAIMIASLLLFHGLLISPGTGIVVAFYVLVDVSVILLLETLWALIDISFDLPQGEHWYRIIGSGALLGGVGGGLLAPLLLTQAGIAPVDLLYVSAGILGLLVLLVGAMKGGGYIGKIPTSGNCTRPIDKTVSSTKSHRSIFLLVATIILLSQVVEQMVEYQFLSSVEHTFSVIKDRTVYLSWVYGIMSGAALVLNLAIFPMVYGFGGTSAGFMMQPLALLLSASGFICFPGLLMASVIKIADRATSYSFHRTTKELLYVPLEAAVLLKTKVWVDILCYRVFAFVGSACVLFLTRALPSPITLPQLSSILVVLSVIWVTLILSYSAGKSRCFRSKTVTTPERGT